MFRNYRYRRLDIDALNVADREYVALVRWGCALFADTPDAFSYAAMGWRLDPSLDGEAAEHIGRDALLRTYELVGRCSCDSEVFLWQIGVDRALDGVN